MKKSGRLAQARKRTKVTCGNYGWSGTQADCGFGHDDFYCPQCGKEALTVREPKAVCPNPGCGVELESCSGVEQIPEHLFCPNCLDKAYDQATLEVMAKLK